MLTVDGREYRVHIIYPSLVETATLEEDNTGGVAQDGTLITALLGTRLGYELDVEPNADYPLDFDALYDTLKMPVPSHKVVMPDGQGTLELEVKVKAVKRTYYGQSAGYHRWKHLHLSYTPVSLQWRAGE